MSWTYDNPSASIKDEIRFLIGDTDTTDQLVTDEEISYLSANHPNVEEAAYEACTRICAKFARLMDTTSGKTQISYSQRYDHYKSLSDVLNAKFADTPQVYSVSMDSPDTISLDRDFDCHRSSF